MSRDATSAGATSGGAAARDAGRVDSPPPDNRHEPAICSAKGCRSRAEWALIWNNPKIHTPDREKMWLACAIHRPTLGDFLGARGFLQRVDPFTPPEG